MLRRAFASLLCALGLALAVGAAEAPLGTFDRVTIAPTKTSIYIGTVALTMPDVTVLSKPNGEPMAITH